MLRKILLLAVLKRSHYSIPVAFFSVSSNKPQLGANFVFLTNQTTVQTKCSIKSLLVELVPFKTPFGSDIPKMKEYEIYSPYTNKKIIFWAIHLQALVNYSTFESIYKP